MSRPDDTPATGVDETQHWSPSEPRDLTGKTLGDFHVERLLGRGGMGEVYLARQTSLNRPVALKVLRTDLLARSSSTYLGRFEAEAAAVAKLNHPNIVHVYTLGTFEGVRFIAMEYVQGTNLKDYLRKKGALDYPLAISIMRQAGLAVGAAGEIGLIHRDIKPENMLLTRKGQVKVADFGLCRDLDAAERVSLTQTGITMGTPLYMSPEQAQGLAIDHRSDLYSLGVTFYHMIAGVPPFRADTALALALKHVKETPVSIAIHRPDVPPDLDRLVLKLIAKDPRDRYQSASEMLRDLSKVRESLNTASGIQPVGDVTGAVPSASAMGPSLPAFTASAPGNTPPLAKTAAVGVDSSAISGLAGAADGSAGGWWWFGPKVRAALIAVGLIAGGVYGWLGRPDDLLAQGAPEPRTMPGLWIAPAWASVAKKNTAEEQYRDALLHASGDDQEAAWLAVPGNFPKSREWAARAYTQLTRRLVRKGDSERLVALAADIERWQEGQTHEKVLAAIARAGAEAADDDLAGVLDVFDKRVDPGKLTDPALIELCLEVIDQAEVDVARPGETASPRLVRNQLRAIQEILVPRLFQSELRVPVASRPRAR
jgi:hypothetical protein